ncbi:Trafficking protein particle complex subunit 4 [Dictyocoela muelleri]|nr:Trafficking protein particle complex subunit 4 [Dictyocoela muelleri]
MISFYIISSSGTLIYHSSTMDINKTIILTSTLHSLINMSQSVFKENQLQYIILNKKIISMFKTLRGAIFVVIGNRKVRIDIFKDIYNEYVRHVVMNPYYREGMTIRFVIFKPINILKRYEF